jgi:DNA-binding winged helix-turn-helix (wHTH) protein/TolB-like protein
MSRNSTHFYDFGPYRLDKSDRLLRRGDEVVPLTPKAFEMLMVLIESRGHVLTKDEFMKRVWPDTIVEEANLSHNIYKLREALGEGREGQKYIETVPRRGYRFVAKVTEVLEDGADLLVEEHSRAHIVVEEDYEPEGTIADLEVTASQPRALPTPVQFGRSSLTRPGLMITAALVVITLIVSIYYWRSRASRVTQSGFSVHSIAVLPFKPLMLETKDAALELGMTDALITRLSNLKEIVVRPTSAVLKYHDSLADPLAAGREQGVDALLDGKVQRIGDRVRVTVQLVRVSDGVPLWGREFNESFTNIFSVQDSISEQVARALTLRLTRDEQKRITNRYTENVEAYQLYLQGRHFMEKRTIEDVRKSLSYYQQAIDLDPNYALAYAGLAYSYYLLAVFKAISPQEAYPSAKRAALKALEIDPELAEGYAALARIKQDYDADMAGAGEDFRHAVELNPNDAASRRSYSAYLLRAGRVDEALREAQRAQETDPLLLITNANLAEVYYYARQWDQTLKYMRRVREIDPSFAKKYVGNYLYLSYMRKGMYEEAIVEDAKRLSDGAGAEKEAESLAALREAYRIHGESGIWRKQIELAEKIQKGDRDRTFFLVEAYTHLGDKDQAFLWLHRAAEERHPAMASLSVDPDFDSLRSDPRFAELLSRLGFRND